MRRDTEKTRIILAENHQMEMDLVKILLEPEYEVVGTFTDGESLINGAAALNPDVVILGIIMPKINGLNACVHLKKMLPRLKVIFLIMKQELGIVGEGVRNGASAFILKTSLASELKAAIREVLRGGYFATPCLTEGMAGVFVQNFKRMKRPGSLTQRQKEILQLLLEGYSMKQIAHHLNISVRTVGFHKYTMMEHLGITSSAELISYAINKGLVPYQSANC